MKEGKAVSSFVPERHKTVWIPRPKLKRSGMEGRMKKTAAEWKAFYRTEQFEAEWTDENAALGMECSGTGTRFRLWSPAAERVEIRFYKEGRGGKAWETHAMLRLEKGIWSYETARCLHGVYYDFLLNIEGEDVRSADPYARACGVNGERSMAVELGRTDPEGWELDRAPDREREQIIYELHVKEFSWDTSGGFPEEVRGTYRAFCCGDTTLHGEGGIPTGLSHLKRLGVNHIQIMPMYDYGSVKEDGKREEFNWGYDPVNYNVPEGSYSSDAFHGEVRIRELKEAVQSLHRQGFRVIMDVVYNHTYSLDSWFQRTVPWYFYRVWEDGTISNGSGCGNDVASEQPMCARYILESVLYWAQEYHIDGFRFDLMGLLDVELMNRIRTALDERFGKGEKLVFGEPWRAGPTAIERNGILADKEHIGLLKEGIGMFSDDTRDAVKGSVFEAEEPGFVNGGSGLEEEILQSVRAWCRTEGGGVTTPSRIISYVSAHDNHTLWDKLTETTDDEALRRKQYRLAAGICLTCQGTPFLLSGEEFARTKGGDDNSYNAPIAVNRLDWGLLCREKELAAWYQGLIALRKQLPGLCDKTADAGKRICTLWKKKGCVGFSVDNRETGRASEGSWETLCIVYNARQRETMIELPEGCWEILADGEDSFRWKHPEGWTGKCKAAPVSILILGQKGKEPL